MKKEYNNIVHVTISTKKQQISHSAVEWGKKEKKKKPLSALNF